MYLAITKRTIHHAGDERSRTHPGHGYPAYDEEVDVVHKFDTMGQVIDWLKGNSSAKGLEVYDAEKQKVTFDYQVTLS